MQAPRIPNRMGLRKTTRLRLLFPWTELTSDGTWPPLANASLHFRQRIARTLMARHLFRKLLFFRSRSDVVSMFGRCVPQPRSGRRQLLGRTFLRTCCGSERYGGNLLPIDTVCFESEGLLLHRGQMAVE